MKRENLIRLLSGLMFLVFFCPFFQMCSDDMILHYHKEPVNIMRPVSKGTLTEEQSLEIAKKNATYNFYNLVYQSYDSISNEKIESYIDDFSELYYTLVFPILLLFSILIPIASLKRWYQLIFISASINLVLFILLIIIFTEDIIKHLNQIKFGSYLFVLNLITLAILSYRKKTEHIYNSK